VRVTQVERWLVTGASGLLGRDLCERLVSAGHVVVAVRRDHAVDVRGVDDLVIDLAEPGAVSGLVEKTGATHVVHAAAVTNVDACERNELAAHHLHVDVAEELATDAARHGARFVYISTDHLWDGQLAMVSEDTPRAPLNAYARTKAAGEDAVQAAHEGALVVRTNFFGNGPPWRASLSDWILDGLAKSRQIPAFADVYYTPIALPLLCTILTDVVALDVAGVLHLAGGERISKLEFALALAAATGAPTSGILATSIADADLGAPRPRDMSLDCSRAAAVLGRPMPTVMTSIDAVLRNRQSPTSPGHR
jgi:dTDP-4-dehydrorhamnose reductase